MASAGDAMRTGAAVALEQAAATASDLTDLAVRFVDSLERIDRHLNDDTLSDAEKVIKARMTIAALARGDAHA